MIKKRKLLFIPKLHYIWCFTDLWLFDLSPIFLYAIWVKVAHSILHDRTMISSHLWAPGPPPSVPKWKELRTQFFWICTFFDQNQYVTIIFDAVVFLWSLGPNWSPRVTRNSKLLSLGRLPSFFRHQSVDHVPDGGTWICYFISHCFRPIAIALSSPIPNGTQMVPIYTKWF